MRIQARTHARTVGVTLALSLSGLGAPACEIDGSIGRDGSSPTEGDGTSGTAGSTAASTGASDGIDSVAGTWASGGEGGGSGEAGGTQGPTDVPPVCHPTPDDEACARCRKTACCSAYQACLGHDSCLCWWECLATDQPTDQCVMTCDSDGLLFEELQICVQMHCDACPP